MGWYISIDPLIWVGTIDGYKYNFPGMGSVSYAMPGELLSPEDKVP